MERRRYRKRSSSEVGIFEVRCFDSEGRTELLLGGEKRIVEERGNFPLELAEVLDGNENGEFPHPSFVARSVEILGRCWTHDSEDPVGREACCFVAGEVTFGDNFELMSLLLLLEVVTALWKNL